MLYEVITRIQVNGKPDDQCLGDVDPEQPVEFAPQWQQAGVRPTKMRGRQSSWEADDAHAPQHGDRNNFV